MAGRDWEAEVSEQSHHKLALFLTLQKLITEQSEGEWDDETIRKDAERFLDVLWPMMSPETHS